MVSVNLGGFALIEVSKCVRYDTIPRAKAAHLGSFADEAWMMSRAPLSVLKD